MRPSGSGELEAENARLKRLVANQALLIDLLKELAEGKLLTPERRRRAVVHLQARFGVSQRRACRVASQHRATQRRPRPVRPDHEARLRNRLREQGQGASAVGLADGVAGAASGGRPALERR